MESLENLNYLERLALQLTLGLTEEPEEERKAFTDYIQKQQNADGGFSGREGPSDLYYTGFALRSLAILNALNSPLMESTGEYLRSCMQQHTSVVDFFSFLYSCQLLAACDGPDLLHDFPPDWQDRIVTELLQFRTADGGFAKTTESRSGSTYHSFLVALCFEMIERPLPEPERILTLIHRRKREDGGYVEVDAMRRGGTNPTAAAVALLRMIEGTQHQPDDEVIDFLLEQVSMEGGICANSRIPTADLLSTFTGLWTLYEYDAHEQLDLVASRRYAKELQQPDGGFLAGIWDEQCDIEYTFYGLGTLAITNLRN